MIMEIYASPGEMVRDLRTYKKVKQKDIAKTLGVSEATICRYESGKRSMSVERFEEILNLLDADYLIRY